MTRTGRFLGATLALFTACALEGEPETAPDPIVGPEILDPGYASSQGITLTHCDSAHFSTNVYYGIGAWNGPDTSMFVYQIEITPHETWHNDGGFYWQVAGWLPFPFGSDNYLIHDITGLVHSWPRNWNYINWYWTALNSEVGFAAVPRTNILRINYTSGDGQINDRCELDLVQHHQRALGYDPAAQGGASPGLGIPFLSAYCNVVGNAMSVAGLYARAINAVGWGTTLVCAIGT